MASPPGILGRILEAKRQELGNLRRRLPELRRAAQEAPPPRDFLAALRQAPPPAIIAEVKRASPSAGELRPGLDPAELARAYRTGGAAALSVLTDAPFFQGSLEDLARARAAAGLAVLRKDFILAPEQLYEARAAGADAVLLIAAALEPALLAELYHLARELGLAVLLEVHHRQELEAALALKPPLMAVNNRNLETMQVDLEHCLRLRPLIPPEVTVVAASGIQDHHDLERLARGGLDAFLVGTSLVRAPDPAAALRRLRGEEAA